MKLIEHIGVSQAKQFDKYVQEKLGIPSLILMENAGRNVAEVAIKMLHGKKNVAVVCGAGNNGGDGFVCARHLLNQGINIKVYIVGDINKIKKDAEINLNIIIKMGIEINATAIAGKKIQDIKKSDLIIDAIFGIGLNSEIKEPYFSTIKFINETKIPVLSIDVPSGLDADRGVALGISVKAKKTVTFVATKIGFYKADGPKYCGTIVVRDIGIKPLNSYNDREARH